MIVIGLRCAVMFVLLFGGGCDGPTYRWRVAIDVDDESISIWQAGVVLPKGLGARRDAYVYEERYASYLSARAAPPTRFEVRDGVQPILEIELFPTEAGCEYQCGDITSYELSVAVIDGRLCVACFAGACFDSGGICGEFANLYDAFNPNSAAESNSESP